MNIADIAAIVYAGGGGGGGQPSLALIHIDESNVLDKNYNEIHEMLRNGIIPIAISMPDDNWAGVYVFLEASYNEDPDDPLYMANALYLDGGNPNSASYTARTPDAPLEG